MPIRGRKVELVVSNLPDEATRALLGHELTALPGVLGVRPGAAAGPPIYEVQVAPGSGSEAVARDIVHPLNAKLGAACTSVGVTEGERIAITFDPRCAEGLRARLEANPPAALYDAPPARRKAVISNPETLRKLMV